MSETPAWADRPNDGSHAPSAPEHSATRSLADAPPPAAVERSGVASSETGSGGLTSDIEREIAEAMSEMSAGDLDELGGGLGAAVGGRSLERGSEITGSVVGMRGDDVFLDFGVKDQGVVPRNQFGKNEEIKNGRRVDVVIERFDADNGLFICYRKGALQRATWINLEKGMIVEGKITGLNKGGLEVDVNGIRAFMPASQVDHHFLKDISTLIGQPVRCEVTDVERRSRNVLVSRRRVQEREMVEKKEELLKTLEVGQILPGTVRNVTDFGAFVDLGGVEGLIHISDLSFRPVAKVTDVVDVGHQVEVRVLKIDRERDRISLGLKQTRPDPWTGAADRYPEGMGLRVTVMRVVDFGAFAELEEGVEGLIPVSEMSWARIASPSAVVKGGDVVDVVVIRNEAAKHRIALSMKHASPDPWSGVMDSFTKGSLVKGTVTRLESFGVFVALVPGVEAMIHISELSDQRVRACGDVVSVGQEIEAKVLDVDAAKRRIALSLKQASAAAGSEAPAGHGASAAKAAKKKRPARGGLSADWDWMGGGIGRS